jgi:hypothetical protein
MNFVSGKTQQKRSICTNVSIGPDNSKALDCIDTVFIVEASWNEEAYLSCSQLYL